MKIQLNIDDKELSTEVKKLVNAQLKSIARNVVHDLVAAEAKRVIGTLDKDKIEKLLQDEIKTQVSNYVGGGYWRKPLMHSTIAELVLASAKNYVDGKVNLKSMYKAAFEKEVKRALKDAIGS